MNIRRTPHLALAAALAAGALLLAACGDDPDPSDSSDASGSLDGTSWVLDTEALDITGLQGVTATLAFTADTASGTSGCNSFTGGYTVDGSDLTFGNLASTQRACADEAQNELERKVLTGLQDTESFEIDGDQLVLQNGDGDAVLTYVQSDPASALVGDWEVTGYLDEAKQAFTSTLLDTTVTVTFGDDGTVSGNAGCNQITGDYSFEGDTLKIGPLGSTRKMCVDPEGVMEQEALVIANLEAATSLQQESTGIVLLNDSGIRVLQLAPAS